MMMTDGYKRSETPDFICVFHSPKNAVNRQFALGAIEAMIQQITDQFATPEGLPSAHGKAGAMTFDAWFIFALTGRDPPTLLFFDSEAEKTLAWSYIGVPETGSVQAYLDAEKPAYGIWSFPELKGALFSVRPD